MKDFKKSDLKNRMVVITGNKSIYMVVDDYILKENAGISLSSYDNNLKFIGDYSAIKGTYDINEVWGIQHFIPHNRNGVLGRKLWQRTEVKEVTMKEIEEKFGCKVKIVNENPCKDCGRMSVDCINSSCKTFEDSVREQSLKECEKE